jgi:hypothetical protein
MDIFDQGNYPFDYQLCDRHGLSFVGHIMKQLDEISDENSEQFLKLYTFAKYVLSKNTLDM